MPFLLYLFKVDPIDVKIGFNPDSRPSGDALVTFSLAELAREAVRERIGDILAIDI